MIINGNNRFMMFSHNNFFKEKLTNLPFCFTLISVKIMTPFEKKRSLTKIFQKNINVSLRNVSLTQRSQNDFFLFV